MRHLLLLALLVGCESKSPKASVVVGSASVVPPPASASALPPSPKKVVEPDDAEEWVMLASVSDLDELVGVWIDVDKGDAIPKGPAGGQLVEGGVRLEIVADRPGSKTPYNLKFWAPKPGHMESKNISGGCGYYPRQPGVLTMDAFCKGYGLPEKGTDAARSSHETPLTLQKNGDHIKVTLGLLLDVELKRGVE
jgi:hypothetical protein